MYLEAFGQYIKTKPIIPYNGEMICVIICFRDVKNNNDLCSITLDKHRMMHLVKSLAILQN